MHRSEPPSFSAWQKTWSFERKGSCLSSLTDLVYKTQNRVFDLTHVVYIYGDETPSSPSIELSCSRSKSPIFKVIVQNLHSDLQMHQGYAVHSGVRLYRHSRKYYSVQCYPIPQAQSAGIWELHFQRGCYCQMEITRAWSRSVEQG